ncbi:MAG: tyrosine-protein phosphatase [Clostridiales bacterium]|jgi:protein-tyrosine phosphatase|nr:tyrosine-protein phosphatase [Clostridiales bacterium]
MTGKDRTGIFSAMLLGLCGAYPADIISDYSISQIYLRPFYLSMMRFPEMLDDKGEPDLSMRFYQTRPETMQDFLEYIDSTYGSMEKYLLSCGLSRDVLEKIKSSFTEDAVI